MTRLKWRCLISDRYPLPRTPHPPLIICQISTPLILPRPALISTPPAVTSSCQMSHVSPGSCDTCSSCITGSKDHFSVTYHSARSFLPLSSPLQSLTSPFSHDLLFLHSTPLPSFFPTLLLSLNISRFLLYIPPCIYSGFIIIFFFFTYNFISILLTGYFHCIIIIILFLIVRCKCLSRLHLLYLHLFSNILPMYLPGLPPSSPSSLSVLCYHFPLPPPFICSIRLLVMFSFTSLDFLSTPSARLPSPLHCSVLISFPVPGPPLSLPLPDLEQVRSWQCTAASFISPSLCHSHPIVIHPSSFMFFFRLRS